MHSCDCPPVSLNSRSPTVLYMLEYYYYIIVIITVGRGVDVSLPPLLYVVALYFTVLCYTVGGKVWPADVRSSVPGLFKERRSSVQYENTETSPYGQACAYACRSDGGKWCNVTWSYGGNDSVMYHSHWWLW